MADDKKNGLERSVADLETTFEEMKWNCHCQVQNEILGDCLWLHRQLGVGDMKFPEAVSCMSAALKLSFLCIVFLVGVQTQGLQLS